MYTATLPTPRPMPFAAPIGAAATAAFALLGSALAVGGTGSVFDISRAGEWRRMLEVRVPFHVDVGTADDSQEQRPDLRSASDHLGNIRQVLNPAIADLATVFGVSRQAIYKWIGGEATPEPDKFERIRALSHAATLSETLASLVRLPRWAACGGLNEPPRRPMRAPAP